MSNFNCDICGLPILENEKGIYITGCKHYPIEYLKNPDIIIQTDTFSLPTITVNFNDVNKPDD